MSHQRYNYASHERSAGHIQQGSLTLQEATILPSIESTEERSASRSVEENGSDTSYAPSDDNSSFGSSTTGHYAQKHTNEIDTRVSQSSKALLETCDASTTRQPRVKRETVAHSPNHPIGLIPIPIRDKGPWTSKPEEHGVCEDVHDKAEGKRRTFQPRAQSINRPSPRNHQDPRYTNHLTEHSSSRPNSPLPNHSSQVNPNPPSNGQFRGLGFPRQEVELPLQRRTCHVHPYFRQPRLKTPRLDKFEGSKAEYLRNIEHIAGCVKHRATLKNACRIILDNQLTYSPAKDEGEVPSRDGFQAGGGTNNIVFATDYHAALPDGPDIEVASKGEGRQCERARNRIPLAEHSQRRVQSSIAPTDFYGVSPQTQSRLDTSDETDKSLKFTDRPVVIQNTVSKTQSSSDLPPLQDGAGKSPRVKKKKKKRKHSGETPTRPRKMQRGDHDFRNHGMYQDSSDLRVPPNTPTMSPKKKKAEGSHKESSIVDTTTGTASKPRLEKERLDKEGPNKSESCSTSTAKTNRRHHHFENQPQEPTPVRRSISRGDSTELESPSALIRRLDKGKAKANAIPPCHETSNPNTDLQSASGTRPTEHSSQQSQRQLDYQSLRKRHRSLPAHATHSSKNAHADFANNTSITLTNDGVLQIPLNNLSHTILERFENKIASKTTELLRETMEKINATAVTPTIIQEGSTLSGSSAPITAAPFQQSAVAPALQTANDAPMAPLPQSQNRQRTVAERMRRQPKLSSDVPECDKKSDDELIQIGKIISRYERHRQAPYAFTYYGTLRKRQYKYLFGRGEWTEEELSRITS